MADTDVSAIVDVLREALPSAAIEPVASIDMPTLTIDPEHALEAMRVLRDHPALQFALLSDLTAMDRLPAEPRFEVVYHLACLGVAFQTAASAAPARRLRVKVPLSGDDPKASSVTSVFPGANWPEREVYDLFGIVFDQHPDLRRILTPEDWTGHPLRKDYPVQIRKTAESWAPIQVSAEEFAENIRRQRARVSEPSPRSRE